MKRKQLTEVQAWQAIAKQSAKKLLHGLCWRANRLHAEGRLTDEVFDRMQARIDRHLSDRYESMMSGNLELTQEYDFGTHRIQFANPGFAYINRYSDVKDHSDYDRKETERRLCCDIMAFEAEDEEKEQNSNAAITQDGEL